MNQNIRIARELVRLAKSLVAADGILDGTIKIDDAGTEENGNQASINASARRIASNEDIGIQNVFHKCYADLLNKMKVNLKDTSLSISGIGKSEGYADENNDRFGKVTVTISCKTERDPENSGAPVIKFITTAKCDKGKGIDTQVDESIMKIEGKNLEGHNGYMICSNKLTLENVPKKIKRYLSDNADVFSEKIVKKLKSDTSLWKKIFG